MDIQQFRELLAGIQREDWAEVIKIVKEVQKKKQPREHHLIPLPRKETPISDKSNKAFGYGND